MTTEIHITENTTKQDIVGIIADATYICYKYNRERTPSISPEDWRCVFGDTTRLEQRYQAEKGR
jgi:hypothetical protein